MSLAVKANQGSDDTALRDGAEWCVRRYAEQAEPFVQATTCQLGST